MTAVAHPSDAAPDDETPPVGDPANASADGDRQPSPTREGVSLIVRFVRMHPVPFVLSLVGGVAWALLVVGATYVLGRITDEVIEPAFSEGVSATTVWWAVAALIIVAVLIEKFKGNKIDEWLKRCLWGKLQGQPGADYYYGVQQEMNSLRVALGGS